MPKGEAAKNIPDLSHLAVEEEGSDMELSAEDLEAVEDGEGIIRSSAETRVSTSHKERNDDKILGVPDRNVSKLGTERAEWDQANIASLAEKESKVATALAERAVYGVFDGVSSGGAGVLASRIASGAISERMAALPKNADAETSRRAIESAIKAAHADVLRYRAERPDLKNMSATADIIRAIDNKDGTFDVAYGHVGDSRIYVFNPASGDLKRQTVDESLAAVMHYGGKLEQEGMSHDVEPGQVTAEELDRLMSGESVDIVQNANAKGMLKMTRNPLMNAVGFPNPDINVKSGTFKVNAGEKVFVMTDGVHGTLSEKEIADVLRAGGGQKGLMEAAAKNREAKKSADDISIVELGFESASKAAQAPGREPSALRRDVENAKAEAAALEALLADADRGDVGALTKVKDKYEGRENVREIILGMKSRALSREEALLAQEGGPGAVARLKEIAAEKESVHGEMKSQIARHERAIRTNLDEAYGEAPRGAAPADAPAAAEPKDKKPFWKRIIGG